MLGSAVLIEGSRHLPQMALKLKVMQGAKALCTCAMRSSFHHFPFK
jgi:hypothetical protein